MTTRVARLAAAYHRMAMPGYVLASVLFAVIRDDVHAHDTYVYWYHAGSAAPYAGSAIDGPHAYPYSPAFIDVLAPVRLLPSSLFLIAWTLVLAAALWLIVGEWAPLALLFPPVVFDIQAGSIHLLLALAILAGFR